MSSVMEQMRRDMSEHMKHDDARFARIEEMFYLIKDNHLFHIEKSIAAMETDIGWLKESLGNKSVDWLTWAIRLLFAIIIGGFLTFLFSKF